MKDLFKGVDQELLKKEIMKKVSRNDLFRFSKYVDSKFIGKEFIENYYKVLDLFAKGEIKKLIVSMPPQHGKSQGSSRYLPAYLHGLNPDLKIAIGSYSSTIAGEFNVDVQRIIDTKEYSELFPNTNLSGSGKEQASTNYNKNKTMYEVVNHKGWLRGVGRGSGLTSKSVDIAILDDVYKDRAEGNSPVVRESAWSWYTSVIRTRLHNDSQELIVFTRWHKDDLIGRLMKMEDVIKINQWSDISKLKKGSWAMLNFPAIKVGEPTELDNREEGAPLWAERHSIDKLEALRNLDKNEFECLNQGNPDSQAGKLYREFKTYINKSDYGDYIRSGSYTDVADEGSDKLAHFTYDIYKSKNEVYDPNSGRFKVLLYALITDIVYTTDGTEVTYITVPDSINRNGVQKSWVESNNGGSQFANNIEKSVKAHVFKFHQSGNKESRVLTSASEVNSLIIFPFGWETRFAEAHTDLTDFLREFKANKHDDIADALTGVYEKELADGNDKEYAECYYGVTYHG